MMDPDMIPDAQPRKDRRILELADGFNQPGNRFFISNYKFTSPDLITNSKTSNHEFSFVLKY